MGWIPDVTPGMVISSTAWGNIIRDRVVQVFASNAERNATAVPRVGMTAWSQLEFELAVWGGEDPNWIVLIERWHPWTPDVMSGPAHLPVLTTDGHVNNSFYRRSFGAVEVKARCDTGIYLASDPADIIHVVPPYVPVGSGDFGIMTVAREGVGWLGPVGAFDPTQLACIKVGVDFGVSALVTYGDVEPGTGSFLTITLTGSYTTGQFSSG